LEVEGVVVTLDGRAESHVAVRVGVKPIPTDARPQLFAERDRNEDVHASARRRRIERNDGQIGPFIEIEGGIRPDEFESKHAASENEIESLVHVE